MHQRWLAAFHAVARAGGFTAAAKLLNVGQPTVSTHVRALEDYFRVELFYRRGRTVELTDIGKHLMTITQGLFGHEEEAVRLLRDAQALEVGSLKVGAIRPSDVMEIAAELRTRYPNLKLTVTLGAGPDILQSLLKFDFDVGIVGSNPQDPRFLSRFYNRHRILIVANTTHPLARRRSIRLEDLEGQNFILRAAGSTTRAIFDQALAKAGVKIRPIMETNNREAVNAAILHGIGIGAISESEIIPHKRLKVLHLSNVEVFNYAFVVCLAERRTRPLIEGFMRAADKRSHRRVPEAAMRR
jgi:LysR family transcriptional regulator, low CO2-responsive transcriptional regulator